MNLQFSSIKLISKHSLQNYFVGAAMNIDGSRLEEKIVNYLPATKIEVEEGKIRFL